MDELDSLVEPHHVYQPPPVRMLKRRKALLGSLLSSAAVLAAACSSPQPTPSAGSSAPAATAAPATSVPAAQPTAASTPAPKPAAAGTPAPQAAATPASKAAAGLEKVQLAFCSQVLCILPYEVARRRGLFAEEGLDVELVYMKGGAQAMNALLTGGELEWVGTPMDLVVQAVAKGKKVQMIASTARLPFFALVTGPTSGVKELKDLVGKKIGVGNLGTTDHLMAQYLLRKANVEPEKVEFVALGPNLFEQLVRGQVDAGMVQEPSLTLVEKQGGKVLVNFMSLKDTQQYLGGAYQFMGLNTRPEVLAAKPETASKLARALVKATRWINEAPGAKIIEAAPTELVAGGDVQVFAAALDKYKADLYPTDGLLVEDAVQRVIDVQRISGAVAPDQKIAASDLFTNKFLKG